MLKIRLSRTGKKGQPSYKIVVAEHARAATKQYVEAVGTYNPSLNPTLIKVDKERVEYWQSKGAQATKTVERILAKA